MILQGTEFKNSCKVLPEFHDHLSRRLQPARTCARDRRSLEIVRSRGLKPAARVGIIVASLANQSFWRLALPKTPVKPAA